MRADDRGGGGGRKRKPRPRKPPPAPVSEAAASSGYQLPARVPPRHTVFTDPITPGPALHTQQRAQRERVRRAEEALPGPAVRLPRLPVLTHYTPAQRRAIINQTSAAIRKAAASGQLDSYLAHRRGEEDLFSRLGHLTDRQTRTAIHKYAGALQTRQRDEDVRIGERATAGHLLKVAPTLANLAEIGRQVRQRNLAEALAAQGEIKPGGTPTGLEHQISGFIDDRVFDYAPNLRVVTAPLELAKATVEDPVGVGKATLRTGIESIAGIPQGIKALVDDPRAALKAMGEDYSHRYGPLLEGNTAKFREQVKEESGVTPFVFDAAAAGAPVGRVAGAVARLPATGKAAEALAAANEPVLSRVLKAAHDTATMERPSLRFSAGEAGVVPQRTSRNLFVAGAQRGLDSRRRRAYEKKVERAGMRTTKTGELERIPGEPTTSRLPGLRPGPGEVLPHPLSPRELGPVRRLTGRVARDIGGAKSKGRLKLLTRRSMALRDIDKQLKKLGPEERAALSPSVKYGLPAVVDDVSRSQALTIIDRRLKDIEDARKATDQDVAPVLAETNDEAALLREIRKDPEAYLTPQLREATDELLAVQRREEALDPDLPQERASIRRNTEQGKVLGVRRGPDEQYLRDRLDEIELRQQARGLEVETGQLQESHGALARMLPEDRPAAAAKLERQAQARWNAAKRVQAKAREKLAEATGRAQILSRNVTGTRAGEKAATAGGGLGVARARRAVEAANAEAVVARDAYAAAREVTRTVKKKDSMRLESAEAFDARVRKAAEEAGLSEPGYWMSTPRPADTYSDAAIGSGGRAVAGSRRYTGALSDIGAETHTPDVFMTGVERNIKRRFSWALVNRNMTVHSFEWSRGKRGEGLTASQILRALDERHIDADSVAFVNARVVADRTPEEAGLARGAVSDAVAEDTVLADVNQELLDARTTLKDLQAEEKVGQAMNRYLVVPKEVADELIHATRPDGPFARAAEIILKQKPARILLGALNVPWLSFQVASNAMLTGLGGGRNPLDIYGTHKWWRGLTDAEKDAVEIELGITHGRHFAMDQTHLGSQAHGFGPINHMVDFWQAYKKSKVGRMAHEVNPMDLMFRADEAQNNFFRKVLFYSQAKKAAYRDLGANWRTLDGLHKKLLSALAVPPEKLGGVIVKHGPEFEKAAKTVSDFLGNYLTYAARERQLLSRNIMFYGYLRFSLRFAFWTMPVEHPVMTAMLSNIGRMGADEIKELFGVPDTYQLPTSMLGRVYSGATPEEVREYVESDGKRGKLPMSVNVGRMNPGLNALTQMEGAQQIVGLASPLYQVLADQLFEESSFTGRDFRINGQTTPAESQRPKNYFGSFWSTFIPGRPRNRIAMADLLGLIYPYRLATKTGIPALGIDALEGPQSDDSLLGSPRPMRYKDEDIKASIQRSIERERKSGAKGLGPQLLPFTPTEDLGPVVIAREREKEADAANRSMGKKRRRKSAGPSASSYGGSGSSNPYGGTSSSYKARYGG